MSIFPVTKKKNNFIAPDTKHPPFTPPFYTPFGLGRQNFNS